MARNIIVASLEKKYARLKGKAAAIEKEAEEAVGAELLDKMQEIYNRQKKMWASMKEIEATIQKNYDPTWCGDCVRGIRPRKEGLPRRSISKRALRALRRAGEPKTTREIVERVREQLADDGYKLPDRASLWSSVHAALNNRVGRSVTRHDTHPITWSYVSQARPA